MKCPPRKARWMRQLREHLWGKQGGRCYYCPCRMTMPRSGPGSLRPSDATMDHMRPRSAGGRDTPDNLVLACYACNQAKGDRLDWPPARTA